MNKQQFKRKWKDTHTEFLVADKLNGNTGSLVRSSAGDKNISFKKRIPGKREIEKVSIAKQNEKLREFVLDASYVRGTEILNPKKMPYKDLLNAAIKLMPTQIEQSGNVNFTFGDMVRKAHLEFEKVDTIEDGKVVS